MRGFSLLEVLITLFILSVGLLGILTLQTASLQRNYSAYLHSVAATQISAAPQNIAKWNRDNKVLLPQAEASRSAGTTSICWFSRLTHAQTCLTNAKK